MVIIKNYKVKKLFNKFPEICGKIGMNFWKFSAENAGKICGNFPREIAGNFRTHNRIYGCLQPRE